MEWKKIEEKTDIDNLIVNIVDDEVAEEGLGRLLTLGTLVFLWASTGTVNAGQLQRNLEQTVKTKQVQQGKVTLTKKEVAKAVQKSQNEEAKKKVGDWEQAKAMNVVARTLYMEARGEGASGMSMVMTVIWNRAGGDKAKFADVCLKKKQFSCWNDITEGKTAGTYQIMLPKGAQTKGADQKAWKDCCDIAQSAFDGSFVPDDPLWNSYYATNIKKLPSWASDLQGSEEVGRHTVGELKWITRKVNKGKAVAQTPTKPNTYTVKDGDTLYAIAGKNMKKVEQIRQLNGLKSDVIKPGQKLSIPV